MNFSDTRHVSKSEYEYTQAVRKFDVFIYGPVLIAVAFLPVIPKWMKAILIIFAVATFIYNAYYFLKYRK